MIRPIIRIVGKGLAALVIVAGAAVGAAPAARAQAPPTPTADPRVQALVAAISVDRMKALDTTLVGFGTRNTLSNATSTTRGIGAARQWIFDELKRSSAKLQVSFDTYQIAQQGRITRPVELRNVMAVLPGRIAAPHLRQRTLRFAEPRAGRADRVELACAGAGRRRRRRALEQPERSAAAIRASTTRWTPPAPTTTAAAPC